MRFLDPYNFDVSDWPEFVYIFIISKDLELLRMANPNLTIIPKVAKLGKKVIAILGCNPSPSKFRKAIVIFAVKRPECE